MAKVIDFENEREKVGYKELEGALIKYLPALVLNSSLEEKDKNVAVESARTLLLGMGVAPEDINPLLLSMNGLGKFAKSFMNRYGEVLGDAKLRYLRVLYSDLFKELYTPENLRTIDSLFSSDETYKSLMGRYNSAAEIANSETGNFTDEQREKATEEVNELNKRVLPLIRFGELRLRDLENKIKAGSLGRELNSVYEARAADEYNYPLAA